MCIELGDKQHQKSHGDNHSNFYYLTLSYSVTKIFPHRVGGRILGVGVLAYEACVVSESK